MDAGVSGVEPGQARRLLVALGWFLLAALCWIAWELLMVIATAFIDIRIVLWSERSPTPLWIAVAFVVMQVGFWPYLLLTITRTRRGLNQGLFRVAWVVAASFAISAVATLAGVPDWSSMADGPLVSGGRLLALPGTPTAAAYDATAAVLTIAAIAFAKRSSNGIEQGATR